MRPTGTLLVLFLLPAVAHGASQATSTQSSSNDAEKKLQILVHASYQPTTNSFTETTTFTQFVEQGSTRRDYDGGTGIAVELGAIYAVTPQFGIGGSFEVTRAKYDATLDVVVPHPLLFGRPRQASTTIEDLNYSERAIHVDLVYRIPSPRMAFDLFAGPTFFFADVELIGEAQTVSNYPFDELSLGGASQVELDDTAVGFNAGAAFTYFFSPTVGASVVARFSRGSISPTREGGEPVELDAGGFRIGGGIRIQF